MFDFNDFKDDIFNQKANVRNLIQVILNPTYSKASKINERI